MPRTAIIIPAYNAAATIGETLESVRNCRKITAIGHIFVCDDASTDGTIGCAQRHWHGDPPLSILCNQRNLGERKTVNHGIAQLKNRYEWVLLLHADDLVKENWLELYFQRMQNAGAKVASICSSYDCWYPKSGRIVAGEDDLGRELEVIEGSRDSVIGTLASGCWWHISGCAIRIDHFLKIGYFRTDMPQLGDYEWLLRCLRANYDIEYIPRTTMWYRMHENSVSSQSFDIGRDLRERMAIFAEYFREGYVTPQTWRRVRRQIIYIALRRSAKRVTNGEIRNARQILSVCIEAARGEHQRLRRIM